MWTLLVGCSLLADLSAPPSDRGPIPPLHRSDGVLYATVMTRDMAPPPLFTADLEDDALLTEDRPPTPIELRAQLLAQPDTDLGTTLARRWTRPPEGGRTSPLPSRVFVDAETCRALLAHDAGQLDPSVYDHCPWSVRAEVLQHYPEVAARPPWRPQPWPDHPSLLGQGPAPAWIQRVLAAPDRSPAEKRQALHRCVEEVLALDWLQACAHALAGIDWAAARATRQWLPDGPTRRILEQVATGAELEAWLDDQGFPPRPPGLEAEVGSLRDRLRQRGALWEPMDGVARLPLLLRALGVEDAVVRSPPLLEGDRYRTVFVYVQGQRMRALLDPRFHVDGTQLIGLANTVARDTKAPRRALWTDDDGGFAVVGTPASLAALTRAEWVEPPIELPRESLGPDTPSASEQLLEILP